MINIPLPFMAMWGILLLGALTHILGKINTINQQSPSDIPFGHIFKRFFQKEWASWGMSVIITFVIAFSFHYMKQFENITNAEISYWSRWIPLAVLILYLIGVLNQWVFYYVLGRIQSKAGKIDVDILEKGKP